MSQRNKKNYRRLEPATGRRREARKRAKNLRTTGSKIARALQPRIIATRYFNGPLNSRNRFNLFCLLLFWYHVAMIILSILNARAQAWCMSQFFRLKINVIFQMEIQEGLIQFTKFKYIPIFLCTFCLYGSVKSTKRRYLHASPGRRARARGLFVESLPSLSPYRHSLLTCTLTVFLHRLFSFWKGGQEMWVGAFYCLILNGWFCSPLRIYVSTKGRLMAA